MYWAYDNNGEKHMTTELWDTWALKTNYTELTLYFWEYPETKKTWESVLVKCT